MPPAPGHRTLAAGNRSHPCAGDDERHSTATSGGASRGICRLRSPRRHAARHSGGRVQTRAGDPSGDCGLPDAAGLRVAREYAGSAIGRTRKGTGGERGIGHDPFQADSPPAILATILLFPGLVFELGEDPRWLARPVPLLRGFVHLLADDLPQSLVPRQPKALLSRSPT